jgi:pimeloyl-ACP methyl ester carboxylesterase
VDAERVVFTGFEGVQLVADVRGDPDGWPVLLLHGGGQTRHAWGSAAERIADEGWRTVSLDLRGHGESDWAPRGDYSFTAFGSDVVSVADQLGHPPVLVGASLGGLSALYAEGTSDRVVSSGLVLVDITLKTNVDGIQRIKTFMESGLGGFDSLDDAAVAIAAYTPERNRAVNPEGLRKVLRERDGRWFWHWDPAFISQGRKEAAVPDVLVELLDTAVSNIRVPTMLVRGLLSDVVTQEGVDHLLESVPGATVVDVAGAAHMIAGDRNDAFTDAVLTFLRDRILPVIG